MCHTSLAYIWPIYFSFFFFFVSSVQFLKFELGHGKMFSVCLFVASLCNCFHVSLENYCRFSCIVTPHQLVYFCCHTNFSAGMLP